MKVIIFGAGKAGRFLLDEVNRYQGKYEVECFLDNYIEGKYKNVEILKPEFFFGNYSQTVHYDGTENYFLAAGAQKANKIMIDTLRGYGVDNIYMMHDIAGKCRLKIFDDDGNIIGSRLRKLKFSDEKPSLHYVEIPITDRCNLNCKGCLFACNSVNKGEDVPLVQIEKDIIRLKELFFDIPWIRILGGEPLLHKKITDILQILRQSFPDTEIDLCTNGIMIPQMDKYFFDCLKKNGISIHISGYAPTMKLIGLIDNKLKEWNIDYTLLKRPMFSKYYTAEATHDMDKNFKDCIASACFELYRGKISSCSAAIAFDKLNQQFGMHYNIVSREDYYNLHDEKVSAWEIKASLDTASNICRYCNVKAMKEFKWEIGLNPSIGDYLIDGQ